MSIAVALGATWGLLAAMWLWSSTQPLRLPAAREARSESAQKRDSREGHGRSGAARDGTAIRASMGAALAALGRPVRRLAAPTTTTAKQTPADHARADRMLGLALVGGLLAAIGLHPLLGVLMVVAAVAGPRLRAKSEARRRITAVVDQLPDAVDLLRLTTLAGLPVSAAIIAIGPRPGGVVGDGLQRAAVTLGRGATTVEALTVLAATCGAPARSLVDALVDHDRYGTPLAPVLDRMAVEYRLRRRQQAEEAARRLPVTLLFPLVLTTLPACALLTIVPLLVASFSSLQL